MPGTKPSGGKRGASQQQHSKDGLVILHRSRFIDWNPSPIVSLASSHDGSLVTALRETGDIELYDTTSWHCFQSFPGRLDSTATCTALVDEDAGASCRLFTAGLDGLIQEHDPETRQPCSSCDSYGGAVWQLVPEPMACVEQGALPRLAAACDDGCVRLFAVEPSIPGAAYSRSLPKVEGRTLAVAWHPNGKAIASAGTDGCIHVWDWQGHKELLRITAGDGSGRKEFCVWDLLFLPDGTLVSADSEGNVQFWDAQFGTLLQRFSQHTADVLRLAASPDGSSVFAAGVDPQLAVFQLVQGGEGPPRWAFLSSKRAHTHDVRALCVVQGKHSQEPVLLSGGNDTQLLAHAVTRFLKEHPQKLDPCPQRPLCHVSTPPESPVPAQLDRRRGAHAQQQQQQQPRLLCSQRNQVDLWQLGSPATAAVAAAAKVSGGGSGAAEEGVMLPPAAPPLHLARFAAKGGSFLTASALSPDGSRVAFSDAHRVHAFQLAERPLPPEGGAAGGALPPSPQPTVAPLHLPAELPPASHLAFLPGGSVSLVACALDGTLRIVHHGGPEGDAGGGSDPQDQGDSTAAAGAAGGNVHVIRDIHNLRHKVWAKRDRHRSAARRFAPAVDLMAVSPDGRWLALAARQRAYLLDLHSPKPSATQLPPASDPPAPFTALAFSADSSLLLAASAAAPANPPKVAIPRAGTGCQLTVYDVATGQHSEWAQAHGQELSQHLRACQGPVRGISSCPTAPCSFLLFSHAVLFHVDTSKPLSLNPYSLVAGGGKRRRGPSRPLQTTTPAGENCRQLLAEDPLLHVQHLGGGAVLVVERPWADVWAHLPAPVYRHRYGT